MKITTEPYFQAINRLPQTGKQILAHQTEDSLVVYQAYTPAIADFAVRHQCLGGEAFSYDRMSWIRPGFLWMMYRSGWAQKENQERILALWLKKTDFLKILREAVPSTFKVRQFNTINDWKQALKAKDVRLQWDPDHDVTGHKLDRRAIQLGLKGEMLRLFGGQFIHTIEDITAFVQQQRLLIDAGKKHEIIVPQETVFEIDDEEIRQMLGL